MKRGGQKSSGCLEWRCRPPTAATAAANRRPLYDKDRQPVFASSFFGGPPRIRATGPGTRGGRRGQGLQVLGSLRRLDVCSARRSPLLTGGFRWPSLLFWQVDPFGGPPEGAVPFDPVLCQQPAA